MVVKDGPLHWCFLHTFAGHSTNWKTICRRSKVRSLAKMLLPTSPLRLLLSSWGKKTACTRSASGKDSSKIFVNALLSGSICIWPLTFWLHFDRHAHPMAATRNSLTKPMGSSAVRNATRSSPNFKWRMILSVSPGHLRHPFLKTSAVKCLVGIVNCPDVYFLINFWLISVQPVRLLGQPVGDLFPGHSWDHSGQRCCWDRPTSRNGQCLGENSSILICVVFR